MPELPEVETIVKTLRALITNQTIKAIDIFYPKMVKPSVSLFQKSLIGKKIESIERIGKFILFFFNGDVVVISHLRMEGKYIEAKEPSQPLSRFARLVFTFTDGSRLIYDDMRKFGTFELTTTSKYRQHPSLKNLGKEPIDDLDAQEVFQLFHHSSRPMKSLLLDQRILLGVGNIYADEILFASKIHPLTRGSDLTLSQTITILKHAKRILHQAIRDGGTRIRTYASGQKIDGEFVTKIKAYGRDGKPCFVCSHRLDKIIVGGRGTHYCPQCQHHPKLPFVIGVTGQIATGKSTLMEVGQALGIPSINADSLVHQYYQTKEAIRHLKKIFPEAIVNHVINRKVLLTSMVKDSRRYQQWIQILFPVIKQLVLQKLIKMKAKTVLLEVPLLFQSEMDAYCDVILGIESSSEDQKQRLRRRNPELADLLWILNERNRYRDYLPFITQRLTNHGDLGAWKKTTTQTLKALIS